MSLNLHNKEETKVQDEDVLWKDKQLTIKEAASSVIKRGLCMVRNEGMYSMHVIFIKYCF